MSGPDELLDPAGPRLYPRKPKRLPQMVRLPIAVRDRLRSAACTLELDISELTEAAITCYLDQLEQRRQVAGLAPLWAGSATADR